MSDLLSDFYMENISHEGEPVQNMSKKRSIFNEAAFLLAKIVALKLKIVHSPCKAK